MRRGALVLCVAYVSPVSILLKTLLLTVRCVCRGKKRVKIGNEVIFTETDISKNTQNKAFLCVAFAFFLDRFLLCNPHAFMNLSRV